MLQVAAFLEKLGQLRGMQPLHSSTTRRMADLYSLDASRNAEIKLSWYKLAIGAGKSSAILLTSDMRICQGRVVCILQADNVFL